MTLKPANHCLQGKNSCTFSCCENFISALFWMMKSLLKDMLCLNQFFSGSSNFFLQKSIFFKFRKAFSAFLLWCRRKGWGREHSLPPIDQFLVPVGPSCARNMIRPTSPLFSHWCQFRAKRDFAEKSLALLLEVCGERSVQVEIISKRKENT